MPTYEQVENFTKTLEFNQPLKADNPVDELTQDAHIGKSTPALSSEVFVYNSIEGASLRDNGAGVLQVVTVSEDDLVILAPDIGTINYETGSVTISNLVITSFACCNDICPLVFPTH